jgi:hypothetical protein
LRNGDPPWDLRDHAANKRFLASLENTGVDTAPWIDGIGAVRRAAPDGTIITLELESDPLEIFRMGTLFKTCLGAGAFNFFSVFAVAADVNKRVLYGRDARGKIIGRCLLALTGKGTMLIFHPYCHHPHLHFKGMVRHFAGKLARSMGTAIVPSGSVANLVAAKWYDDGSEDIAEQFPFLSSGTAFRASLKTIEPDRLVEVLKEEFVPLPLNELTLPLVLRLDEIRDRPELIVPLLPIIQGMRYEDMRILARAARLAAEANHHHVAMDLARKKIVPGLLKEWRQEEWLDSDVMDVLVDVAPSEALSLLKQTRPRGVQKFADESSEERLAWAARALHALHRPRQALKLFRKTPDPGKHAKQVRKLEKQLGIRKRKPRRR